VELVKNGGSGEPGLFLTNNKEIGANPCVEISLKSLGFCNLVETNVSDLTTQEEYEERCRAAAFIATLQASYTDFHYLRDGWKRTAEKEALIGVSMTGIASGNVLKLDMTKAAKIVAETNKRVAQLIGINPAARTTTCKPSGTSSIVLGTSSGIHAWHNDYYIRRVRIGKNEAIYHHLFLNHSELVKDEYFKPHLQAVIEVPQKAPEGATLRTESAISLLERVKKVYNEWVLPGHNRGDNTNNISCTVTIKDGEWVDVGQWMWDNRSSYTGLSVLPYDSGTYVQAPFEDCTKEQFEEAFKNLSNIDLTQVVEFEDLTDLQGEAACSAGGCTVV
jgi:ribonucleoside-diphosphate reductase alpha chain